MAQFKLDSMPDISGGLAKPHIKLPEVKVGTGKGSGDYLDMLKTRSEQVGKGDGGSGLKLSALEGLSGLATAGGLLGPGEGALREAREQIEKDGFAEALPPLERALKELRGLREPNQHQRGLVFEAIYLQALCQFKTNQVEPALRTLRTLHGSRIPDRLETRVRVLQRDIRGALSGPVMLLNLLLANTGRFNEANDRLRQMLALDPGAGIYHFMVAGNLMLAERTDEALAAAGEGARVCADEDRQMLLDLKAQIERHDLETRLAGARTHYRNGNYPRARTAIERLAPRYRESPLATTFHLYLQALGGGLFGLIRGKPLAEVKPEGRFKEVDTLHFFLVGADLRLAKACMSRGQYQEAQGALATGLRMAPHFPYAHHLMGVCLYEGLAHDLAEGNLPDLDQAEQRLDTARSHAKGASVDTEIEDSKALIEAIDKAIGMMGEIRKELEKRRKEAERMAGVMKEYQAIMQVAEGGISSPQQFRVVYDRMQKLKGRLAEVRRSLVTDEGRTAFGQFEAHVDKNCEQLEQIKGEVAEAGTVEELMGDFAKIMENAKGGVGSVSQLRELRSRFDSLRTRIREAPRKLKSEGAKKAVKQLSEAVDRNWKQLEELDEAELEEAEKVKAVIQRFHALMGSVQGGIGSRNELYEFKNRIERLASDVAELKRRLRSGDARKALDDLFKAIANVTSQLP